MRYDTVSHANISMPLFRTKISTPNLPIKLQLGHIGKDLALREAVTHSQPTRLRASVEAQEELAGKVSRGETDVEEKMKTRLIILIRMSIQEKS